LFPQLVRVIRELASFVNCEPQVRCCLEGHVRKRPPPPALWGVGETWMGG
jgi:hypothetical protein